MFDLGFFGGERGVWTHTLFPKIVFTQKMIDFKKIIVIFKHKKSYLNVFLHEIWT